ncbi:MAG: POT family MFS transporter [Pirellulales bacterium]
MSESKYRTTPYDIETMPPGIPYIIGNEAAERFSFYGMRAILAVFLTEHLLNSAGKLAPMSTNLANEWQHYFVAAAYFFPIVGSILSDWLWGKYSTILRLSLLYCAGHAVMALVDFPKLTGIDPRWMLFAALSLIAIGAGGIKPCVSAHVGDQFGHRNKSRMSKVFGWFYFSINFGAMASTFLTPWLLTHYGPGWAFGVPGILMAIATFVFWLGRNKFVHIPPGGTEFLKETYSSDGLRAVANLTPLYIFTIPFWSLLDQTQSQWVHQAKLMDRWVFGYQVLPSQLQAANPVLVMIFIPLFTYVLYPLCGRWFQVTPLRKIGVGLLLTGPAFAITGYAQELIDEGQTPHITWQLSAYVLITACEVMVYITALEFSYTQAPKKMKSLIMGVFFLGITLGNIFTAQVNGYIENQAGLGRVVLSGADYYWFFTILMVVSAVIYVFWSQFYHGQTYIQGETDPLEA